MQSRCFLPHRECKFVIDIVDSLQKLLAFVNPGKFGEIVLQYIVFKSEAEQTETIKLSLEGYVMYIYVKAFKEAYPLENITELQKERINAIWDAIGHPDKKLS
jgi:hypothetical protein